jgi:LysM repeat protein
MQRVGYDSDTQRYTLRSTDGTLYHSAPGSRYGDLTSAGHNPTYTPEETEERNKAVEKNNREAVRMMLPFALLVFAFLLVMFKLMNGGFGSGWLSSADAYSVQLVDCTQGSRQIRVEKGDTCWGIAERYRLGVEELLGVGGNEEVECERLSIGQGICVPA